MLRSILVHSSLSAYISPFTMIHALMITLPITIVGDSELSWTAKGGLASEDAVLSVVLIFPLQMSAVFCVQDEVFHVPQTQAYCGGRYGEPMIHDP